VAKAKKSSTFYMHAQSENKFCYIAKTRVKISKCAYHWKKYLQVEIIFSVFVNENWKTLSLTHRTSYIKKTLWYNIRKRAYLAYATVFWFRRKHTFFLKYYTPWKKATKPTTEKLRNSATRHLRHRKVDRPSLVNDLTAAEVA